MIGDAKICNEHQSQQKFKIKVTRGCIKNLNLKETTVNNSRPQIHVHNIHTSNCLFCNNLFKKIEVISFNILMRSIFNVS